MHYGKLLKLAAVPVLLAAAVFSSTADAEESKLCIAPGGESRYAIVLSDDASPSERACR